MMLWHFSVFFTNYTFPQRQFTPCNLWQIQAQGALLQAILSGFGWKNLLTLATVSIPSANFSYNNITSSRSLKPSSSSPHGSFRLFPSSFLRWITFISSFTTPINLPSCLALGLSPGSSKLSVLLQIYSLSSLSVCARWKQQNLLWSLT